MIPLIILKPIVNNNNCNKKNQLLQINYKALQIKNIKFFLWILSLSIIAFISCQSDVDIDSFTAGDVDVSNYVAIGNSLAAGSSDNALYIGGQEHSYPALLAQQFQEVGGDDTFKQPLMDDELGGFHIEISKTILRLLELFGIDEKQIEDLKKSFFGHKLQLELIDGETVISQIPGEPVTNPLKSIAEQGPFNNLGIPGAKSFNLTDPDFGLFEPNDLFGLLRIAAGRSSPYYARFTKPNVSIIDQAISQNPTFFTLWIGNNDALLYAQAGGEIPSPLLNDLVSITPIDEFANSMNEIAEKLAKTNAKGVVANIIDLTSIPSFSTIPYNATEGIDQSEATKLNERYRTYNAAMDKAEKEGKISKEEVQKRKIEFKADVKNPIVIDDETLTVLEDVMNIRQANKDDLIIVRARNILGKKNEEGDIVGTSTPLSEMYVLNPTEQAEINNAVSDYNKIITRIATENGWALADMNALFKEASKDGLIFGGEKYTERFITGGLFSLDATHPTRKGQAAIANAFIDAINDYYGTNIPEIDINLYPGVLMP